jgi:tetratricopeptide (TPR) repeat protein
MSYLRYFTPNTSGQRGSAQSVFGGISGLQQSNTWPTVRIAAVGISGSEAEAMGIVTVLRYLLSSHPEVKVYPAYYQLGETNDLQYANQHLPFDEIKNQLTLGGDLNADGSLTVWLHGLLVAGGSFTSAASVQNPEAMGAALIKLAHDLLGAIVGMEQPAIEAQLSPEDVHLAELWDLEDLLVSSLTDEYFDESKFLAEVDALLPKLTNGSLESFVLGQMLREAASGPYGVSLGTLRTLFDTLCEAKNDTLIAPIVSGLILTGRSDLVVDSLMESISAYSDATKLLFADAAVYSGHIRLALEQLQQGVREKGTHAFARAYADTVRYLFETGRLEPNMPLLFSQSDDIVEEIVEAYRFAYEKEPIAETGLRLLDFELAAELEIDEDIAASIVQLDKSGIECQNLISVLSENELIEQVIDAIEEIEELDDTTLIGLALLYVETGNEEAAKECLEDVTDKTSQYYRQTAYLVNVPDADKLIFEMSQKLIAGGSLSDEQIDVLESVIAINDMHEGAYNVLARAYAARDDLEAALEVLDEGIQKTGSSSGYLQKAQLYWESDQHAQAIQTLLDGVEQFPQDGNVYALLARYLFDAEQVEEAREFLRKADYLAPEGALLVQVKNYIGANLARD